MYDIFSKRSNTKRKYKDIYNYYKLNLQPFGTNKKEVIFDICNKFYITPRQAEHIIRLMVKKGCDYE